MQYNSYIPPMVRVVDTRLAFADGSKEVLSLEIDVTP